MRQLFLKILLIFLISFFSFSGISTASNLITKAKQAIVMDFLTNAVLYEKDADTEMYPASMTKIMTALLIFEGLKDGSLHLDDEMYVSEKAWREREGSSMFVMVDTYIRLEDLIRGIVIQSGNDACIVVAENLAGSEDSFVELMNERARELGMRNTNYANATGMPDPNHKTTARDVALLSSYLIKNYPRYYHFFSETDFIWEDIKQGNRNPLLYKNVGVDGLKTGHTKKSGYGLAASGIKDNRRIIFVINGLKSSKERSIESLSVINWAYREFRNIQISHENRILGEAEVWLGKVKKVSLVSKIDYFYSLRKSSKHDLKIKIVYEGPIPAPIEEGQEIANLQVIESDKIVFELPLYAKNSVAKLGFFQRISSAFNYLIWGSENI